MRKEIGKATGYGLHILIAAIKYLDGRPNGCEGIYSANDRAAAIHIMLRFLPKRAAQDLWADRKIFWGRK